MTQKTRPLSHRIQKRTGHRRTLAEKHYENFSHKILDSRVPLCYAISEGRPRLCNMSSEAGALPSELRIENDSDRKFSKSTFFKVFLETMNFCSCFMLPRFMFHVIPIIMSRKYFFRFSEVRTYIRKAVDVIGYYLRTPGFNVGKRIEIRRNDRLSAAQ